MRRSTLLAVVTLLCVTACGGGGSSTPPRSYTVGGTIAGLQGTGLVLLDNGGSNLSVSSTTSAFTFTAPVASGNPFNVTVMTQPGNPSQTCTVADASGVVTGNNITNVAVTCTINSYKIGGTVSGLTGSGLVVANGTDTLSVTSAGAFTFQTPVASGNQYAVTVSTQPINPSQTCVPSNASGTVQGSNVTDVSVVCTTNFFSIGGGVAGLTGSGLVLTLNGSTQLPVSRGQFAFPGGPVQSGTKYSVAITTQPTNPAQTCTLTNPSGAVTNAAISIAVICPNPVGRFAYVTNLGACGVGGGCNGTVSAYSIDPASGAFTAIGGPVATGLTPASITIDSQGGFLYVGNDGNNNLLATAPDASLSVYKIDSATGALTPFSGNPLNVAGAHPVLTVGADGRFAYLATDPYPPSGGGGGVVQYSIDAQTGGLAQIGNTFLYPDTFSPLVIEPSAHFAYSAVGDVGIIFPPHGVPPVGGGHAVVPLPINAGTGTLAVGQPNGVQGAGPVIDPTGRFLYVWMTYDFKQVRGFLIDPTTGGLTPLVGNPFTLDATAGVPIALAIHPNGAFLYASEVEPDMVAVYAIDAGTGAITAAPTPVGSLLVANPAPLTFDPSGRFAYISGSDISHPYLLGFTVNTSTGALTAMNGTLPVGANPTAIAILR
jgi:6-phosphogluconolactonase (cycloisomerase 2 family)